MTARKKATHRPRKTAVPPRRARKSWASSSRSRCLARIAPLQDPRAEVSSDLVADRVADDRRDDDHDQHAGEGDVAEPGRGAGEQGHGLAGEDEADEQRVLGEHDQAGDEQDQPAGQLEDAVDEAAHAASVPTAIGSHVPGKDTGAGNVRLLCRARSLTSGTAGRRDGAGCPRAGAPPGAARATRQ